MRYVTVFLVSLAIVAATQAATINVPGDQATIEAAVNAAVPGDTVQLAAGTYTVPANIDLNKASLTIAGAGSASSIIEISGTGYRFSILAAGVTLRDLQVRATDKTDQQNIVWINADNATIQNNVFCGQYVKGEGQVSRAMVISGGHTGLLIDGNTIHGLRQPAYISGPITGTVSNNYVYGTKGWVVEQGNLTFTGNTWGTGAQANIGDIAILSAVSPTYYTNILAMSAANNGAVIEDQRLSPPLLSVVYVDAAAAAGGNGTAATPYQTIGVAIPRVMAGGTIHVAAGTYNENLSVTKALSLLGAGKDSTIVNAASANYTLMIKGNASPGMAGDVLVDGFTFQDTGHLNWCVVETDHIPAGRMLTFRNSDVANADGYGWWDYHSHGALNLTGCVFKNVSYALQLEGWDTGDVTIDNNEFVSLHTWMDAGVPDTDYPPVAINPFCYGTNCTNTYRITNNRIHDYTNAGRGIVVNGGYPGNAPAQYTNMQISRNSISGIGLTGIRIKNYSPTGDDSNGGVVNGSVTCNAVSGSDTALLVVGKNPGLTVNNNAFVGNGLGLDNQYAAIQVNAASNWWGVDDGGVIAGMVSGNVNYTPWLTKPPACGMGNVVYLDVPSASVYVQPGESIIVNMDVSNLQQMVKACQAMLGYSSEFFADPTDQGPDQHYFAVQPGGGVWDQLIYDSWRVGNGIPGEIDTAVGVLGESTLGTQADGTVAKITLTANDHEGTTKIVFRSDVDCGGAKIECTYLADMSAAAVLPNKVDSVNIIVDKTAPAITAPADATVILAQYSMEASASDTLAGLDTFTMNGTAFTSPAALTLAPGVNTFTFVATDRAGNSTTKVVTITYNQPAPTITIPKSVAPNAFGAATYPDWQANSRYAVLNELASYGTDHAAFQAVTAAQDYTVNLVTNFNSWLGMFGAAGEYGNRLTYVYRIDNGVKTNPGAAKLELNNVSVALRNYWTGADNSPADDVMDTALSYGWATRADPAEFGAGNARLKGYNWVGGAWVEVVGGRSADLIIFDNGQGYDNGSDPAGQGTLNNMYKQLSGAVANKQYNSANTKRQTLTRDEYEVKYTGHTGVGDADVIATANYISADHNKPVITITAPATGVIVAAQPIKISGTVTDNGVLDSGVRDVTISGSSYHNTTQDPVSFNDVDVTLSEGANTITVTATDFAGNTQTQNVSVTLDTVKPTIHISDTFGTNPVLQGSYIVTVTAADAAPSSGLNGAPVMTWGGLTASAGVQAPTGTWTYTVTVDSATANGAHMITANISDLAGNAADQASRTINVNKNKITGQVQLEGFVGTSRVVTFVATGGTTTKTWDLTLTGWGSPYLPPHTVLYTLTDVPDDTKFVSAKTAWSLRKQLAVSGTNGQWTANFTGTEPTPTMSGTGDYLRGGDLDGTNSVNILDYTRLKTKWYTADPAADIDGSGAVNSVDYAIMKSNWFGVGE